MATLEMHEVLLDKEPISEGIFLQPFSRLLHSSKQEERRARGKETLNKGISLSLVFENRFQLIQQVKITLLPLCRFVLTHTLVAFISIVRFHAHNGRHGSLQSYLCA